jgi:ABC-2 type transport system ATP-binding protein
MVSDRPDAGGRTSVLDVPDLVVGQGARIAVDGIGFSVKRGEIFGLLGPNGAPQCDRGLAELGSRHGPGGSHRHPRRSAS